jgi:hypothetical protein
MDRGRWEDGRLEEATDYIELVGWEKECENPSLF